MYANAFIRESISIIGNYLTSTADRSGPSTARATRGRRGGRVDKTPGYPDIPENRARCRRKELPVICSV